MEHTVRAPQHMGGFACLPRANPIIIDHATRHREDSRFWRFGASAFMTPVLASAVSCDLCTRFARSWHARGMRSSAGGFSQGCHCGENGSGAVVLALALPAFRPVLIPDSCAAHCAGAGKRSDSFETHD